MGLLKKINFQNTPPPSSSSSSNKSKNKVTKRNNRRKSFFSLISPSDVTEESLEVWRCLPPKIRHDPSMVSFQLQQEKLHGNLPEDDENCDDDDNPDETKLNEEEDSDSVDQSEFITIKVTDEKGGIKENVDDICVATEQNPSTSHKLDRMQSDKSHGHYDIHDTGQPVNKCHKYSKLLFLLCCWFAFTVILTQKKEKILHDKQLSIEPGITKSYLLTENPKYNRFLLTISGAFLPGDYNNQTVNYLSMYAQHVIEKDNISESDLTIPDKLADIWTIPIIETKNIEKVYPIVRSHEFELNLEKFLKFTENSKIRLRIWSNIDEIIPIKLEIDVSPMNIHLGVIFAALLLVILYGLIIWEVIHRTFAAVIVSTLSVAALAYLDDRPTMPEIVQWINVETLLLLFSMMILVALLTETGIFDYIAVYFYKITNGKIWPLIHCLCIFTVIISGFLDNVTTVLLMTPVTIRLCEVMELNPTPVLMGIIVHANIGGTMTPVGDPSSIIITSNDYIAKHGITFLNFTLHMTLGVLIVVVQTWLQLRFQFRNINDLRFKEPKVIKNLRREITVWERAAASLSPFSKNGELVRQTLHKKVKILKHQLKKQLACSVSTERYKTTLEELQNAYPIKNKNLLIQSGVTLAFIIVLFFVNSVPSLQRLSLGWSSLLGVILLLIITKRDDMDAMMHRIEWTTLLFFAAMFIIMECIARLGMISWIGKLTETLILSVADPSSRLAVAIMLVLWISAITSAFVDSVPVTTMMVKIVVSLAANQTLGLPLQPLIWALAFGPCLGGNGTLVGASANIVCAGIAEQHGYKFSFIEYFKVGFPIMIGSVIVTSGYLMLAHVLFAWH